MKSFLTVLGMACVLHTVPVLGQEPVKAAAPIEIAQEPLTTDSRIVRSHLSDLFRIVFAEYAAELKDLRAKQNPTPAESKALARREADMKKLLVIYDQAVKVSPVVFAVSIQLGFEVPSRLLSALPLLNKLKRGEVGIQYSGGITLAMTRNEATGRPALTYGLTQIAGGNFTVGKKEHDKLRPRAGVTWLTPAIAILVPLVEEVPSVKLGDLQGIYWGGAGELSTPAGEMGRVSRTLSLGFYAKLKPALEIPDAGMIYMFHGMGGEVTPPSGQGEALWLSVIKSGDGSEFRSPIPYVYNNSSSEHSNASRHAAALATRENVEGLTGDEVLKRIVEVQGELAKSKK